MPTRARTAEVQRQDRESRDRYYQRNKALVHERNKAQVKRVKQVIFDYKEANPCADCGEFYPHYVMEFDHCRGTKAGNISTLASQWGVNRLMAEIEKCDLVCANCHRVRTYMRTVSSSSG